ncbi:MAG: hypothetical protein R3F49_21155 [Planctomycetota bacterium]
MILVVGARSTERSVGIGTHPTLPKGWARAKVLVNGPQAIVAERQLGAKLDVSQRTRMHGD